MHPLGVLLFPDRAPRVFGFDINSGLDVIQLYGLDGFHSEGVVYSLDVDEDLCEQEDLDYLCEENRYRIGGFYEEDYG